VRIAGPSPTHACKAEKQYKATSSSFSNKHKHFKHETKANTNNILQKTGKS